MILKRPRKYRNKPITVDGVTFDSQAEARRWHELRLLERSGHITNLMRQHPLELVRGVKLKGEAKARPAIRLVVDFAYWDVSTQRNRFEDVKGIETPVSRIKRHMAKALLGVDVEVVK